MTKVIILLKHVLLIIVFAGFFSFLHISFAKSVSAAPFNVTVNDTIPGSSRWTATNSGCSGQRGIVIQCVSNCSNSSMRWDCNDGLGGHLNIWTANTGTQVSVQIVEPLPGSFTRCTWSVVDRGPNISDTSDHQEIASGSDCTASFQMDHDQDWRYGVFFRMHPSPTPTSTPGPTPTPGPTSTPVPPPPPASTSIRCTPDGQPANTGVYSAVGCIPFGNQTELTAFFLKLGIGIGGGIAFLMMVYAGIQIITAAGNAQKLASGKELLVAAVSGILLLVFSVFLFRLVGRDLLKLPNF